MQEEAQAKAVGARRRPGAEVQAERRPEAEGSALVEAEARLVGRVTAMGSQ